MFDLTPAADRMVTVLTHLDGARLDGPTPCPDYTVGDLVDHVGGLALAFAGAARKTPVEGGPSGDASRLEDGWATRIATDLGELADAWKDPDAWQGIARAGGFEMPAEVAAVVTLNELVLHGWDLAVATGQPYEPTDAEMAVQVEMLAPSAEANPDGVPGLYGPPVSTSSGRPFDRILALAGRDPGWTPAR